MNDSDYQPKEAVREVPEWIEIEEEQIFYNGAVDIPVERQKDRDLRNEKSYWD